MTMEVFSTRWCLWMKAVIWRAFMAIGMKFHNFADPKPPSPDFKVVVPSRLSPRRGTFELFFYVPQSYLNAADGYRFPVVVNFHGGGFTIGTATDDARWASAVVDKTAAVVVSVGYRLAPEFPFSVGVEDGTDAIIYLASHAEELRLDPHQIVLSGFSAGGNLAFTVPLMLHDVQNDAGESPLADSDKRRGPENSISASPAPRLSDIRAYGSTTSVLKLSDLEHTTLEIAREVPDINIRAIISFYPTTDFREPRDQKRATNPAPETNLSIMLTDLFDQSYIYPAGSIDFTNPYLSPAAASDNLLRAAYPEEIVLFTCEYDMLNAEGVAFGQRLSTHPIAKMVHGGVIKGVPHGFDKKPNPLHFPEAADRCYAEACIVLKRLFSGRTGLNDRRQLDERVPPSRIKRKEYEHADGSISGQDSLVNNSTVE